MTKEEARIRLKKLKVRINSHKNCIDKKEREIIELEAIIHKKDEPHEYILWNKPLLSLQDIDATIKGHLPEFDELRKIAKGRRAK